MPSLAAQTRYTVLTVGVVQVDPYKKPQQLLEVNPRGLVPALRHGDWGCYESTVLMEYVESATILQKLTCTDQTPSLKTCRKVRHCCPAIQS